jgi:peptidoglycan/xylan/chitin deacetylase (PgdA/CDA1 family)
MKQKKIIIIWDFDGPIGLINSTYPYNFNYSNFKNEQNNVLVILDILDEYEIKTCFAITGFSAEEGEAPYSFTELIFEIYNRGHEIASHSWKHEWLPLFNKNQICKSLKRSQQILEHSIKNKQKVVGFVPPHNRPMTWWRRAAISIGDRGIYPMFKMADNECVISVLRDLNYRWYRVSYKNLLMKFGLKNRNITGRTFYYKDILILENHYPGFDDVVINHILNTNYDTYTLSAHPLMFDFKDKKENKTSFLRFLDKLEASNQLIEYVRPMDLINAKR